MARKKAERKPKSLGEAVGLKNIFNNEKSDFLLGIILLFVAVYLIIAMVSYLKTGQADQSILENMRPGEWLNQDRQFINYCGSVGAILSYQFRSSLVSYSCFYHLGESPPDECLPNKSMEMVFRNGTRNDLEFCYFSQVFIAIDG